MRCKTGGEWPLRAALLGWLGWGLVAACGAVPSAAAGADEPAERPRSAGEQEWVTKRHRDFARQYSGVALIGRFTIVDEKGQTKKAGEPERYEILQVSPLPARDLWLFRAKVQYGGGEAVVVPIPLRVLWAGDTPVITLDNQAIPGLGTFSARVMLHGTRYAGTWQHGKVGGHMWGVVEPLESARDDPPR